jgi:hypothetical protein
MEDSSAVINESPSYFQMDSDVHELVNKGLEKKYAHHRILLLVSY